MAQKQIIVQCEIIDHKTGFYKVNVTFQHKKEKWILTADELPLKTMDDPFTKEKSYYLEHKDIRLFFIMNNIFNSKEAGDFYVTLVKDWGFEDG